MEAIAQLPVRKRYSSDLSARNWQRVEPLLQVRRSKRPLVEVMTAGLYVLKNGCPWHDLPGDFLLWGTMYQHFSKLLPNQLLPIV